MRKASIYRETKETQIEVEVNLDHIVPKEFAVVVLEDVVSVLLVHEERVEGVDVLALGVLGEFFLRGLPDVDERTKAIRLANVDDVLVLFSSVVLLDCDLSVGRSGVT